MVKSRVLFIFALIAAAGIGAPAQVLTLTVAPDRFHPHADSLTVDWTIGTPPPGPIGAVITSNIGSVPYQISATAQWISVITDSAVTPVDLTIQINPAGLAPGTYVGSITVSTTVQQNGQTLDASDTTTITLVVSPSAVQLVPSLTPTTLTFSR